MTGLTVHALPAGRLTKLLIRCVKTEIIEEKSIHPAINIPAGSTSRFCSVMAWLRVNKGQ